MGILNDMKHSHFKGYFAVQSLFIIRVDNARIPYGKLITTILPLELLVHFVHALLINW